MNIRKFLRGTLCGAVAGLVGCMPANQIAGGIKPDFEQQIILERELEKPTETVPAEPRKLKKWQYPVNILGGYLTHISVHESGHAIVGLLQGGELKEYCPYPGYTYYGDYAEFHGGVVRWKPGAINHTSPQEKGLKNIAGPLADVLLAETINYKLRNGCVPKEHQPFWATTSLMARAGPVFIAVESFNGNTRVNDFKGFEKNTGISKETIAGLVGLYTALNAKRIAKDFKVALGKDSYDYNPNNTRIDLIPTLNGINLIYTLNF